MSIRELLFGKEKKESSFILPQRACIYYLISGRKFVMNDVQYDNIREIIEGEGYELFYMPGILPSLSKAVMKYNFPGVKLDFTQEDFSMSVADQLNINLCDDRACLVWYNDDLEIFEHTEPQDSFEALHEQVYIKFNAVLGSIDSDYSFSVGSVDAAEEICDYSQHLPMEEIEPSSCQRQSRENKSFWRSRIPVERNLYDLCDDIDDEVESAPISSPELDLLAQEAKEAIDKLLLSGFSAEVIKGWLDQKVKLSRIRITKRNKILLVDYDIEVKMGPLPKTVFLFFLRHPEGMRFVDLQDYKQEIYDIYSRLAVSDDLDKIKRSVDLLTDPFDNSINEKCTMIKYAFQKVVKDDIASNYYVSGKQGHVMKIPLDRTLVEWE
jgi:hypothetical protein